MDLPVLVTSCRRLTDCTSSRECKKIHDRNGFQIHVITAEQFLHCLLPFLFMMDFPLYSQFDQRDGEGKINEVQLG